MWLLTPLGFFSVVHKRGEQGLTVRSRARGDLLRLQRHYLPELSEPVTHEGTDYPWRARCSHQELGRALERLAQHIDYPNFKDEVALSHGKERAHRYARVWQALHGMADDLPEPTREGFEGLPWSPQAPVGNQRAFGGVVVDPEGRVLLREVAGHFDGYVWSFAKGRADPGESPRQSALREVREEMGVQARILLPLPSTFQGTTTQTQLFLMVVDPRRVDMGHRCKETSALRWAWPGDAKRLIAMSTNATGRERDLRILDEALRFLPPVPLQRPIARLEDWEFRPMPAKRQDLAYRRSFKPAEMAHLVRGFMSQVMAQKWCAYFEDGVLRIHRSWTGCEIFRLHLLPSEGKKGHWSVCKAELNRHPEQCTLSEPEALAMLEGVVENILLRFGEEPATDGLAQAFMRATQTNYLGSPRVVQSLVRPYLDAIVHSVLDEQDGAGPQPQARALVSAMTDDPAYTRIPWHSREQLGQALIEALDLEEDPGGTLGLRELLQQALAQVEETALSLAHAGLDAPGPAQLQRWLERLEELGQFLVAVLLGTHTLSHPGHTLKDVVARLKRSI